MDILLFLGGEFLRKMTDPSVSAEERESLRYELSAFVAQDEGRAAAAVVEAFNRLDFEELLTFDREAIVWYLDWVTMEQPELCRRVQPESVAEIWSAFNEPVVRTRALEVLVDVESLGEVRPSESRILDLVRRVTGRGDQLVTEPSDGPEVPNVEAVLSQITNTLLTDQRSFSLRVLGETLESLPLRYRQHLDEEIDSRLATLGEVRARALREAISSQRRRE